MTAPDVAMFATFTFIVGMRVGMWIADNRWRRNADDFKRIESGGRIYKVTHEE